MMAVFTGCTFAGIRSAPEIANTDARAVLGQRHSENNGLASARRRTVFLLPPWRSAVAAHEEPSRMPPKFFEQPGSHGSSALCAGDRFRRRRGAFSAAGQQAEAVVQAANDLINRPHPDLYSHRFDGQRYSVEATADLGHGGGIVIGVVKPGRARRAANNSMALSANDMAASMTAWSQPDFGDGVVQDSGNFDSPLREFDAVSRRGGDAA